MKKKTTKLALIAFLASIMASATAAGGVIVSHEAIQTKAEATAQTEESFAKIGDTSYATFDDAITAANAMTGDVTVEVHGKVEYSTSTANLTGAYDSISFVGKTADAEISITRNGSGGYITGDGNDANVSFEALILSKPEGGYANDAGFMNVYFTVYRVGNVSYTNCVFPDGACSQGTTTTYTNCEFANTTSGEYSLWVYAATTVTVTDCKFTGVRGAKMYGEGAAKTGNLTLTNTEFTESVTEKPAIVLTYGESVTLDNNIYPVEGAFELDLAGNPNGTTVTADAEEIAKITCVNDAGDCGVLVDGKIYTTVAQAAEAATEGSTVTLLHDSAETVEFAEGVTLDTNGHTAENVTVKMAAVVMIGDTGYATLEEALEAAKDGDIVTLMDNIELSGAVHEKIPAGVTIDGNGKTITVESIFNGAANAAFYNNDGAYKVKNLTVALTTNNNTNGFAFDMKAGGTLENVTIDANFVAGVFAGSNTTITGCVFNTATSGSFYGVTTDGATTDNVVINDCEFNGNRAAMLYGTNVTFTNNTVTGAKGLSVATTSGTVSGNTFTGERAMSVSAVGATISENNISAESIVEFSADGVDLSGNYWGGENGPSESQLVSESGAEATVNSYYTAVSEDGTFDTDDLVTVAPAVVEVATYEELVAALVKGNDVKLTTNITCTGGINGTDVKIDLNTYTLTLQTGGTNFQGESTIENGTIDVTGCAASGDCIIGIGDYTNNETLTLNNVNITGENYSSAYAILYVYGSGTLNINGGSIVVANDSSAAGGVIKAESAANGKINVTGTADDPVELTFTDAKIGILDGTVVMDYVDLDITGGANAINGSALTVKNSTLTIKDCDGRALTLNDGDVTIENSTLDFSGATEGEIRFKQALTLTVDGSSTISECNIYTDTEGAKVNDVVVTGTETSQDTVTVANGVTTVKAQPTGTITFGYTSANYYNGIPAIFGEANKVVATESFVVEIYSGETLIATATLNDPDKVLLNGVSKTITWHAAFKEDGDTWWNTVWTEGSPNTKDVPDKVVLCVDGVDVSENTVKMSGPDDRDPVVWRKIDGVAIADLEGEGTAESPYLISSLAELKWFRDDVNTYTSDGSNQYKGQYVKLTTDIDLDGSNWTPIGTNSVGDHMAFLGTFYGEKEDGSIPTISNLYVNADGDHLGFFARVGSYGEDVKPTVKNLNFNNVDVSSNTTTSHNGSYVGGVIANAGGNSVVSGITVTGNVYVVGYGYVGGIVGHGYPDIDNCHVNANANSYVNGYYWCVGGIIGYAGEGGTPITNSSVSNVKIWSGYGGAAAIAGLLQDGNKLENVSASSVEITSNSNYVMGYIAGNGEASTMTDVTVSNVTATANGETITSTDAIASIGDNIYFSLAEAFAAAKKGDTIELLRDIAVTDQIKVTDNSVLSDITINGNGYTITADLDKESESVFYLGDTSGSWATGVKIKDLTIAGTARYAIMLVGGTSSTLENVTVTGDYYYGINFYGTHGGTLTNCNIVSGFTNGQFANPIYLNNSTIGHLAVNDAAVKGSKVFVYEGSSITSVECWSDSTIMIDSESLSRIGSITVLVDPEAKDPVAVTPVAEVNSVRYATLQAAIDAAKDGDTVTLLADVAIDKTVQVNVEGAITIDGNGYEIINNGATNAAIMLGSSDYNDSNKAAHKVTLKNVVFDGWTTDHVVRVQGVTAVIEGCTFVNCNQTGTGALGLLTLTYADATVSNCEFADNTCVKVIDVNSYVGNGSTASVTIENCSFTNNTVVTANVGMITAIDGNVSVVNNEFVGNIATANIIYTATDATVSGNYFADNTLNGENKNKAVIVAGPYAAGTYTVDITGNAFMGDTYVGVHVEDWTEQYSATTSYDLNGNYWNGEKPNYGVSGDPAVSLDNYYTTCNYADGSFTLKGEEIVVAFKGVNLTVGEDLTVNFYVNLTAEQAEKATMKFDFYEGFESVEVTGVLQEGVYKFSFEHIAPQHLGDEITATLFIDGVETCVKTYSIKQYCDDVLTKSAADLGYNEEQHTAFRTLIADMLNYGAAAQTYRGYNTDNLVNEGLTVNGTEFVALTETDTDLTLKNNGNNGVTAQGATVYFDKANALRIYFTAENVTDMVVYVTKNGAVEGDFSAAEWQSVTINGTQMYYVETADVLATEFDTVYTFEIGYEADLENAVVVTYSVNSYVYQMQDSSDAELVKALWCYGASAKAFLALKP